MAERWPALGVACPCDDQRCEVVGSLTKRQPGHARGCICVRCTGRRNVKKGWDGQRRMHKALGGRGRPPRQEEWARGYELEARWVDVY